MILDPKTFHALIETIVAEKGCGYMDAALIYREQANVEIETVSSLIKQNPVLKAKVHEEAEVLRLVKATPNKLKF